jgi:TetR/AcrR family transcriptional regulator
MRTASRSYQESLDQHRRQVIVDAARRVFEKSGLEAASIRAIAQMAGCTTGAIYPHFASKEVLFAVVLGGSLSTITLEVRRAMHGVVPSAKALRRGTLAIYKHYDAHPSDLALALAVFNADRKTKLGRGLDAALKQQFEVLLEVLAEQVGKIAKRPFRPMVRLEVTALVTHLVGLLVLKHRGRIDTIGNTAPALLAHYTRNMVARLTGAP